MNWGIVLLLFALGAAMGSFAGAAAWRLKHRRDIVRDRSECEHCHHKLSAIDLIPIVSWLMLGGRCRYCRHPIGVAALLIEIGLGLYFAGSYLVWPFELASAYAWFDFCLWLLYGVPLAILFLYDLRWYLLPDVVVWPLVVLGGIDFIANAVHSSESISMIVSNLALSLAVISGLYYLLHKISRGRWVGLGDVKLGLFIGPVLGWQSALVCLVFANVLGVLCILPGLVSGRLSRTSRIPFGPFLIAGCVIAGLFGPRIADWYLGEFAPNVLML